MGDPLAQLRNSEEENLQVKAGETPIEWNQQEKKSVLIKKDLDARWTKKLVKKRPVNADSVYRSKEKEESLIAVNIESRISEKGSRNHPLTTEQKASNTEKSRIISRDEIIFGAPSSHRSTLRSNNRNDESGLQYNPSRD